MDTITRGILLNQTFLVEDEDNAKSIQTCIPSMTSLKQFMKDNRSSYSKDEGGNQ